MLVPASGTRSSRPVALVKTAAAILLAVLAFLLPHAGTAQQPLPIRELAYSAKFLCGAGSTDYSLPTNANEMTVIEVHNSHSFPVTCTIKWVQDYPTNQIVIPPCQVIVASNGALHLDCNTLYLPGCPPVCGTSFRGVVEIRAP